VKRDLWPEIWGWIGISVMLWSLFEHGALSQFHFIMGMLALNRGSILENKREFDRWRGL
jgi:hypothetical protein